MSASNNAPGDPSAGASAHDLERAAGTPSSTTFKNDGGVLAVDMSVLDAEGTVLGTWTRSDPSDIIGTTVGGNRYGWLVNNDFDGARARQHHPGLELSDKTNICNFGEAAGFNP